MLATAHRPLVLLVAAAALAGVLTAVPSPVRAADAELGVVVLSNRADLVSGGDALVHVTLPAGADAAAVRVDVDGRDVTDAFAVRPDGRYMGLVTGLVVGDNLLTATLGDGSSATLEITNHPRGGPVFAGPQVQPWLCETEANGLGPAQDEQCNTDPVFRYEYKNSMGQFAAYDPESPPSAGQIATTTTDEGNTVPYIVRIERGVIDRGFYDIAVLFDPTQPWEPWAPQAGWNGKVLWPFGSGGEPSHRQIAPPDVMDDAALSRGFAVATTAMAHNSQGFHDVVQAEAVMMVKEHLIDHYGEVRYTIGTGCSGGSMSQYAIAANYPGILDGIMPACSFPDVLTTYTWFSDCKPFQQYFIETSPHLWPEPQKSAVLGHAASSTCTIGSVRSDSYASPTAGSNCAGFEWTYEPENNPGGERCSVPDYMVSVYGRRAPEVWTEMEQRAGKGFANRPYDTIGIQWGQGALLGGTITTEQFVDLNEKIGGLDIDANVVPERSLADLPAVETAYRTGRMWNGREMAKVPHIELRGSSNFEWHHDVQSIQVRNRLIRDNGHAGNMIYWKSSGPLLPDPTMSAQAFLLMDRWLAAIEADASDASLEEKVIANKPVDAVDACWIGGERITDQTRCAQALPHYSEPRAVAGQPATADLIKCQLEPLSREAYADAGVTFTDAQWERLEATFPDGVCDYSKPGVLQQAPMGSWVTFADGPGGRLLGPAPVSVASSAQGARVERYRGTSRLETATAVSGRGLASADTVVLARADDFADALAGAPLAVSRDAALLLTERGSLSRAAADEIRRLGAEQVILLGGPAALSADVAAAVEALGTTVQRVAGANRYATAAEIAREVGVTDEVLVASGEAVPDALAASGLAAALGRPVLLTGADELPAETADVLGEGTDAVIVGGAAAVSDAVASAVDARAGTVTRLSGATRYATSSAVAREAVARGISPAVTWVASGEDFPDALVAGAAAGRDAGVLLLVHADALEQSPEARVFVADHAAQIQHLRIAGGPAAISSAVEDDLAALLG